MILPDRPRRIHKEMPWTGFVDNLTKLGELLVVNEGAEPTVPTQRLKELESMQRLMSAPGESESGQQIRQAYLVYAYKKVLISIGTHEIMTASEAEDLTLAMELLVVTKYLLGDESCIDGISRLIGKPLDEKYKSDPVSSLADWLKHYITEEWNIPYLVRVLPEFSALREFSRDQAHTILRDAHLSQQLFDKNITTIFLWDNSCCNYVLQEGIRMIASECLLQQRSN